MPRVSEMYPSEWLKFAALTEGDQTLTIEKVSETVFEDQKTGKRKPQIVLHFREIDQKLSLGVGNANTLAQTFGDDTDDWVGKRIVVGCATANNGTDYVQVREKPTQAANRKPVARPAAPHPSRQTAPPVTQAEVDEDISIPF
jgi:hypothetical protein